MFDLVLAFPVHSVRLAHPRDGALIVNCSNDGMSWNKELGKIKESREYIKSSEYNTLYHDLFLILTLEWISMDGYGGKAFKSLKDIEKVMEEKL